MEKSHPQNDSKLKVLCAEPGCPTALVRTGKRGRPQKWCEEHKHGADSKTQTCRLSGCSRPRRAHGLCNAHYRRELRAEGREKNPEWGVRRKKNYQQRKDRLEGASNGDKAILEALIARGDLSCTECGDEIDLTLEYPHPKYRTIDHKKPLAKGGKHILSNCQLMHAQCNASKGVRLSEKA